ncbi:hypothetical protein Mycch_2477 [Mycolicibacterium chubuense NBB4]|uniref:DoxX-like family protein n=1 Tax=Mycolicibacterium chubuense (strain NBB4) TaxID=710421 RepID=I4BIZ3_MYCCN|nr:DoxX family protein [Mycolicibacterium chubuense]AFM17250.1 hypothetical protein Mycch_2477 [Mycolicibacterium chubuense NBB4]
MTVMTSKKTYAALAAFHAVDAVASIGPIAPIKKSLDDVGLPEDVRPVLPVVHAAAAVGLLSVFRFPWLARLTTFMLTVYFVLAVGSHVRVRDWSPNLVAASSLLAFYGALTVKGPPR